MRRRLRPCVCCLLVIPPIAFANEAAILDEVVVSGSRVETALALTPVAIGRIDSDAMDRDKPKTMGDILNRIAGVSWNDLGNEQHSMGIRQPNSTNSVYQYLEDGIPIRPLGVFNHNSLNELNMSSAESVEVVKGPSSSLYGSNAVGGAVNFLTAKPTQDPYASIGVRRDSINGFDRYDSAVSDSYGNFGFRVAHYSSRRDANNWQEYSYGDKDSVNLRMDYRANDWLQLRSTYVFSDLDSAMTGNVFETDYRTSPGHSINTFTYRRDKTQRATLAAELHLIDQGNTTVTGFWRKNDHGQLPSYTITGCAATTCRGTINNNHVDSVGVDIKHVQEFDWASARLIGGVFLDVSDNPYVNDNIAIQRTLTLGGLATLQYVSYAPADLSTVVGRTGRRDYESGIVNYAPFVQFEFAPWEPLRFTLGGRFDAIEYEFKNHLTPGIEYGAPDENRTFSHVSPKVGATYAIADNFSVYANASEGFTAPDVSQLYGKSAIPDLKPATYRNYEVGARFALLERRLKLEAAAYRLEGSDTIVSFSPDTGDSYNRNAGETLSKGVEFSAAFDSKFVDARLGAAFASHRYIRYEVGRVQSGVIVDNNVNYDGLAMPQAPSTVTAEIGVQPIADLRIAFEGIRQGSYWMNNANTIRYEGHTLLNVRGTYTAKLWGQDWNIWLQGRNLTDKLYADSASSSYPGFGPYNPDTRNAYTPGAPRSVMVGFTFTFGTK